VPLGERRLSRLAGGDRGWQVGDFRRLGVWRRLGWCQDLGGRGWCTPCGLGMAFGQQIA